MGSEMCIRDRDEIQKKVAEITDVDKSFESQLDSLTISLLELDEEKFVKLLNKNFEQRGCTETMLEVIYPLLDKLALMWMSGSIKNVHEKFVSHLIKRKCDIEIDKSPITRDETFLIFLPYGETNALSLHFLHFLIRDKGFKVINVGHEAEISDIVDVMDIKRPDYIFTIINDSYEDQDYLKFLDALYTNLPKAQIFMSGLTPSSVALPPQYSDRINIIDSSRETIDLLASL